VLFLAEQVLENSIIPDTPTPTWGLQAFDVAAERILLQSVEGLFDAVLVFFRKLYE
jgi:hypothetical protein